MRIHWIVSMMLGAALAVCGQGNDAAWKAAMEKGNAERDLASLQQAVQLSAAFAPDDPRVEQSYIALMVMHDENGHQYEADKVVAALVARLSDVAGTPMDRALNGMFADAERYRKAGNHASAAPRYRACLLAREIAYGKEDPRLLEVLDAYAAMYVEGGYANPRGAALLGRALRIRLQQGEINAARAIACFEILGGQYQRLRGFGAACQAYQRACDLQNAMLPAGDPARVKMRMWLYKAYEAWGKYAECLALQPEISRCLADVGRSVDPSTYRDVLRVWDPTLRGWPALQARMGYYREAADQYAAGQSAIANPEAEPEEVTRLATGRMGALIGAARYAEAREVGVALLALQEGATQQQVRDARATTLWLLARCHRADGDVEAAKAKEARGVAIHREAVANGRWRDLDEQIACRRMAGDQALGILDFAWNRMTAKRDEYGSETHPIVADAKGDLADLLMDAGKLDDAEKYIREALSAWEQVAGPDHRCVLPRLRPLAACLVAEGKLKEADTMYVRAVRIAEEAYGKDDLLTGEVLGEYAVCVRKQGRQADADALEARAKEIRTKYAATEEGI